MKKIPTLFERDQKQRSLVTDMVNNDCLWVFSSELSDLLVQEKLDGTACYYDGGDWFKRYTHKAQIGNKPSGFREAPEGWVCVDRDEKTGKSVGWVPVGLGPEDQYHQEAIMFLNSGDKGPAVGTYELLGPKVQGNPHGYSDHRLIPHDKAKRVQVSKFYHADLKQLLADHIPIEGLIITHKTTDAMAKIKRKDFGLPWPVKDVIE